MGSGFGPELRTQSLSTDNSLLGWLSLGAAVTGTALQYKEGRKARKNQEAQFRKMMEAYNKPDSQPKPLQAAGGGSLSPIKRGGSPAKKRRKGGPSKSNQGLLASGDQPSLLYSQ